MRVIKKPVFIISTTSPRMACKHGKCYISLRLSAVFEKPLWDLFSGVISASHINCIRQLQRGCWPVIEREHLFHHSLQYMIKIKLLSRWRLMRDCLRREKSKCETLSEVESGMVTSWRCKARKASGVMTYVNAVARGKGNCSCLCSPCPSPLHLCLRLPQAIDIAIVITPFTSNAPANLRQGGVACRAL